MVDRESRLAIAKQHLAEARKIIKRHKRLIERRKQSGLDNTEAEALLRSFERALADFEDDLAGIEPKMKC
jgi:outer membrane protein TolC